MLRWLLRLGFVGVLAAAAIWAWSQLNQDLEDEELDDEIPIEFDVPLELEETVSDSSVREGDTGVGPGADFSAEEASAGAADSELTETAATTDLGDEDLAPEEEAGEAAVAAEENQTTPLATADEADADTEASAESSAAEEASAESESGPESNEGAGNAATQDAEEFADDAAANSSNNGKSSTAHNDLEIVVGIGPVFAGRLVDAGIHTLAELAVAEPDRLHEIGFTTGQAEDWIRQANELTSSTNGASS